MGTVLDLMNLCDVAVDKYGVTRSDLEQVYVSPHPYNAAFEEDVDLCHFSRFNKPTGGMKFTLQGRRLILQHMEKSLSGARIARWCSCLK